MNSRQREWAAIACLAASILAIPSLHGQAPQLEGKIEATGLASLTWAGEELLKTGTPALREAKLEKTHAEEPLRREFEAAPVAPPEVTFEAARQTLRHQYSWGMVSYVYELKPARLDIGVEIHNTSDRTLAHFEIIPLELRLPVAVDQPRNWKRMAQLPGDFAAVEVHYGEQKIIVCTDTVLPLHLGVGKPANQGMEIPLLMQGGVQITEPGSPIYHPLGLPRVAPGQKLALRMSLRFAAKEADAAPLLADAVEAFRHYLQPRFEWPDRRPIGSIFFATGKGPVNNPRRWFNDDKLDVRTEEGQAELRRRMLAFADQCIVQLKALDAQGAILWNPEGEENPHPISYIGDPRMVKLLAPEMVDILPEFFRKIADAGFRVGTCLRPTQVYQNQDGKWSHGTGSHGPERNPLNDNFDPIWPAGEPWWRFYPVVERMSRKIAFARENWGCTIFYVDTNGVHRGIGEDQKMTWTLMDPHLWQELHRRHPDVLFIPEFAHSDGQYAFTSCYLQPPYSSAITPERIVKLLPGAFSVTMTVNLDDADWNSRRPNLLKGLMQGDSMFFRGWFGDHYNSKIKLLYHEAEALSSPAGDTGGNTAARLQALAAADPGVRFQAAQAVGQAGDRTAVPALVKLIDADPNWAVRQAAIEALGTLGGEAAVAALEPLATKPNLHQATSGRALGQAGGPAALPIIEATLGAQAARGTWEAMANALAQIDHPDALPLMKRILDDESRHAKWAQNTVMQALARRQPPAMFEDILARLGTGSKDWDAEIAATLAAYGDRRAIDPLLAILEREAGTKADDGKRAAAAARQALERITGHDGSDPNRPSGGLAADAWRKLLGR